MSEDHLSNVKLQEKNQILYNEVARIGQTAEQQRAAISGINHQVEERLAYLEQRLGQSEQNN